MALVGVGLVVLGLGPGAVVGLGPGLGAGPYGLLFGFEFTYWLTALCFRGALYGLGVGLGRLVCGCVMVVGPILLAPALVMGVLNLNRLNTIGLPFIRP